MVHFSKPSISLDRPATDPALRRLIGFIDVFPFSLPQKEVEPGPSYLVRIIPYLPPFSLPLPTYQGNSDFRLICVSFSFFHFFIFFDAIDIWLSDPDEPNRKQCLRRGIREFQSK
jgi:hypothetical protein